MKLHFNSDLIEQLKSQKRPDTKFKPKYSEEEKIILFLLKSVHNLTNKQVATYIKKEHSKPIPNGTISYLISEGKKLYKNRQSEIDISYISPHQGKTIKSPKKSEKNKKNTSDSPASKKPTKTVVKKTEDTIKKTIGDTAKKIDIDDKEKQVELPIIEAEISSISDKNDIRKNKTTHEDQNDIIEPEILGVGEDENKEEKIKNLKAIEKARRDRYKKLQRKMNQKGLNSFSEEEKKFFASYLDALNPIKKKNTS